MRRSRPHGFESRRQKVAPRYCKTCNSYIKRGDATPSKYKKKIHCDDCSPYVKSTRNQDGVRVSRSYTKRKTVISEELPIFLSKKW